jgi:hypothetical protein
MKKTILSLGLMLVAFAGAANCSSNTETAPIQDAGPDALAIVDAGGLPDGADTGRLPETGDGGFAESGSACTGPRDKAAMGMAFQRGLGIPPAPPGGFSLYFEGGGALPASDTRTSRIYVSLLAGSKVAINDVEARTSKDWDLAFRSDVIFTNGGNAGPGMGAAKRIDKPFADVSRADVPSTLVSESFTDPSCPGPTSFDAWFMIKDGLTVPVPGTWIVRTAKGELHKFHVLDFYAGLDTQGVPVPAGTYLIQGARL